MRQPKMRAVKFTLVNSMAVNMMLSKMRLSKMREGEFTLVNLMAAMMMLVKATVPELIAAN